MNLLGKLLGRRGTGWKPSPRDVRDYGMDRLGLSARDLPVTCDVLGPMWPTVYDQGATSSCTGNAVSAAMAMQARYVHGDPSLGAPSRSALYYSGRALTASRTGERISDTGAYLRDVFDAARRIGAPFERDVPFSARRINQPPHFRALVSGHGHRGGSYVRVLETGAQKSLAVRAALAAGFPVVIGSPVSSEYTRDGDDVLFDVPDPASIAGGHAQVLTGYDWSGDFGRFRVVNSWGQWRDAGRAWLTDSYVEWPWLEAWVIYGWEVRS